MSALPWNVGNYFLRGFANIPEKATLESHGHTFQGHRLSVDARYRDSIDRYSGSSQFRVSGKY